MKIYVNNHIEVVLKRTQCLALMKTYILCKKEKFMRDPIENISRLQTQLNDLQLENQILKNILDNAGISYGQELLRLHASEELCEFDKNQGARIKAPEEITEKMANKFFGRFWGRQDVYAIRNVKNSREFSIADVDGKMHLTLSNGIYVDSTNIRVYDYVDSHIPMFDNMYAKRLKAYSKRKLNKQKSMRMSAGMIMMERRLEVED